MSKDDDFGLSIIKGMYIQCKLLVGLGSETIAVIEYKLNN